MGTRKKSELLPPPAKGDQSLSQAFLPSTIPGPQEDSLKTLSHNLGKKDTPAIVAPSSATPTAGGRSAREASWGTISETLF